MSETEKHTSLAEAKLAVMGEVGYVQKSKSPGLNYSYAGESALIEALRPALVRHGLTVAPVAVQVVVHDKYQTKSGACMNHLLAAVTYRLTHAHSKESEDCQVLGEAADSGDKVAPKAMTLAYKYFLRQSFLIETGDDPDKYAEEAAAESPPRQEAKPRANGSQAHTAKNGAAQQAPPLPQTGPELLAWLQRWEAAAAKKGDWPAGDLVDYMVESGRTERPPLPDDIAAWDPCFISTGLEVAKKWIDEHRKPTAAELATLRELLLKKDKGEDAAMLWLGYEPTDRLEKLNRAQFHKLKESLLGGKPTKRIADRQPAAAS